MVSLHRMTQKALSIQQDGMRIAREKCDVLHFCEVDVLLVACKLFHERKRYAEGGVVQDAPPNIYPKANFWFRSHIIEAWKQLPIPGLNTPVTTRWILRPSSTMSFYLKETYLCRDYFNSSEKSVSYSFFPQQMPVILQGHLRTFMSGVWRRIPSSGRLFSSRKHIADLTLQRVRLACNWKWVF